MKSKQKSCKLTAKYLHGALTQCWSGDGLVVLVRGNRPLLQEQLLDSETSSTVRSGRRGSVGARRQRRTTLQRRSATSPVDLFQKFKVVCRFNGMIGLLQHICRSGGAFFMVCWFFITDMHDGGEIHSPFPVDLVRSACLLHAMIVLSGIVVGSML